MKRTFRIWILPVILLCLADLASAQVPNPADITSMALYKASVGVTDSIPDNLVNYNITAPAMISAMITGIESDTLRQCERYEAKNNAYLYVKFLNGSRKVYHIYLNWMHFSKKGDRANCFYINPLTQVLFRQNAQ